MVWTFQLARLLSIGLHPFVVFTALALLAAWRLEPDSLGRTAIGMAAAITILAVVVAQRIRGGHWETVDASRRKDRPLLYGLALLVLGGYWLWMGGRASPASSGVVAAVAMLCLAAIANRWIKLSLHVASLAFASLAAWPLSTTATGIALALLPALAWARLRMARHKPVEVAGGATLGFGMGAALLLLG